MSTDPPLPHEPPEVKGGDAGGLCPLALVAASTVNVLLVAVPPGVVTATVPVVAPAGTVASIWVSELTRKVTADVPLNATAVVPLRPVPVIVTISPTTPLPGSIEVTDGGGKTMKGELLEATPPEVFMRIAAAPTAVPLAMVAVIDVAEFTVNDEAAVAPKVTAVAPLRPLPVIVTTVPTGPLAGVKELMTGGG
jgi:hypothetical protein